MATRPLSLRVGRPNLVLLLLLVVSLFSNWVFFFSSYQTTTKQIRPVRDGAPYSHPPITSPPSSFPPPPASPPSSPPRPASSKTCETFDYIDDADLAQRIQYHLSTRSIKSNTTEEEAPTDLISVAQNKLNFPEDAEAFREVELEDLHKMMALTEYNHRRFLWSNSELFCCQQAYPSTGEGGKVGWVTATINDAYVIPAVALAHSIRKFSCHADNLLAIVSYEVGPESREALARAGWQVLERPPLDCQHEGARAQNQYARFPGEHMRFHVWNLTDYDRLIYVDCDIMLLDNLDELFRFPLSVGQVYAAHFGAPGHNKRSINSGLLVLRPSCKTAKNLIKDWQGLFKKEGCIADQPYLHRFFDRPSQGLRWLPYAYNVRRQAYHPMRLFHMAGGEEAKLWLGENVVRRKEEARDVPILEVPKDAASVWWFMFYDALDAYDLHAWWLNAQHTVKNWHRKL